MNRTVVYDNTEFEVLFDGRQLLCVRDPEEPTLRITPMRQRQDQIHVDRGDLRKSIFAMLASAPCKSVKEMRLELDVRPEVISGVLIRAIMAGEIERVSYGIVRLKRDS